MLSSVARLATVLGGKQESGVAARPLELGCLFLGVSVGHAYDDALWPDRSWTFPRGQAI